MHIKKRRFTGILFFLLLGLSTIIIAALIWWRFSIQPVNINSLKNINFTITNGAGLKQVAVNLKEKNLIRNSFSFIFTTKVLGLDNSIQAGTYKLSPAMDTITITKKLTKGFNDTRITIPEGLRSEEIASIINTNFPDLATDSLINRLNEKQGYLFPDTYDFSSSTTIDNIIETMSSNFQKKYKTIRTNVNLSEEEIVIIASLIEREARHAIDRPLVSSVIYNRYKLGMKLDIDATVQYAVGFDPVSHSWWKKNLTIRDLDIDSDFNTYIHSGLPPKPIANPGLFSLIAAASPSTTDYLYYMTDKNGVNHYAKNITEHNENIRIYGL
jgi:UPF0755 protein